MWSKAPCPRRQRDGQGPPDPKFEVLTSRPHTPSHNGMRTVH